MLNSLGWHVHNVEHLHMQESTIYIIQQHQEHHSTEWPNAMNKFNSTMLKDVLSRFRIRLATSFNITQQSCIQPASYLDTSLNTQMSA